MPSVCVDENLTITSGGKLQLAPWSVPRQVAVAKAYSGYNGAIGALTALPGLLLIDQQLSWRNETPVDHTIVTRISRGTRAIVVSNPNAVQVRDRWTWAFDDTPTVPVTSGIFNSQCGLAGDIGTNSIAEPNPGMFWTWRSPDCIDDWQQLPVTPGQTYNVWYRLYVWTPPPWSDNANKNSPFHAVYVDPVTISLIAFPQQAPLTNQYLRRND